MHPLADTFLAFILFIPWFAILGALYWLFPRHPVGGLRRAFDAAALGLAVSASLAGTAWAYAHADLSYGPLWRQVLATLVGYGLFLLVLTLAFSARQVWLRRTVAP